MNKHILSLALVAGLAACSGGNPFDVVLDEDGNPVEEAGIPEAIAQNLESFQYNAAAQTLTVVGVPTDDGALNGVYRRRPDLDRVGYEAYTAQDGSLDRHFTAYVGEIRGTQAVTIGSGGQFEEIVSGNSYSTTSYSSPGASADGGLVSYAGNYVGLLNGGGSGEDLLPVADGTPASVLTTQAAEVTGKVLVTGDFADSSVTGVIFERTVTDVNVDGFQEVNAADPLPVDDIALDITEVAEDGSFEGTATQDDGGVGTYAGIFGGSGATEVAGAVVLNGHIEDFSGVIENGIFVLSQCGQADEDALCNQPNE